MNLYLDTIASHNLDTIPRHNLDNGCESSQ